MITINYVVVYATGSWTVEGMVTHYYPVTITGKDFEDCENQAKAFTEDMKMNMTKPFKKLSKNDEEPTWYYYIKK